MYSTVYTAAASHKLRQKDSDESSFRSCRICLQMMPSSTLQYVTSMHRSKILSVLNQEIHRKDAQYQICTNCCNLLEIVLDFRDTAQKANVLLVAGKKVTHCDSWNRQDNVSAIALCKEAVETLRKSIDGFYEQHCKERISQLEKLDDSEVKLEPVCELEEHRNQPEECEIKLEDGEKTESHTQEDSYGDSDDGSSEDDVPLDDKHKSLKNEGVDSSGHRRGRKPKEQPEFMSQLCDFCGKRVCGESAEGHKNQHLGIKPYPCTVAGCNLSFHGRYNRLRHLKRMHGENGVEVHNCHVCGKTIRGPIRALRYHLQRHERNQRNEKNFVCQVCGKGFTLQRYLAQHSIIHSGEFPHKCSHCGKKFNNKWGMRSHEKKVHETRNHISSDQQPEKINDSDPARKNKLKGDTNSN